MAGCEQVYLVDAPRALLHGTKGCEFPPFYLLVSEFSNTEPRTVAEICSWSTQFCST